MVKRLTAFEQLSDTYLFSEMKRRQIDFLKQHPLADLIPLAVGDTVYPLGQYVCLAMQKKALALGNKKGYLGYQNEQGDVLLRQRLAHRWYQDHISAEEIFISDGAKCDLARLQMLFGPHVHIGVQDPAYPVYVEGSLLRGVTRITKLACHPKQGFFPPLDDLPRLDLLYICSPHNPTGVVYTHKQLLALVNYALRFQAFIIFDSAYAGFVQDPSLPRSIYEIERAKEVAIEVSSFSKIAGFSGVRLGWSVIPNSLAFENGHLVLEDWKRLIATTYNGASNLAQQGGISLLEDRGWREMQIDIKRYIKHAKLLKTEFEKKGFKVYGAEHIPYLWIYDPSHSSWELFQYFLDRYQLLVTPGIGFGQNGEHCVRLSAFVQEEVLQEVLRRLRL